MAEVRKEQKVFTEYPVGKAIFTLAVPTIITQLINIIYNLADTWYVGRTGNPAMVAALTICMPVYIMMAAIANLFGIGGASVISRSLGMNRYERARKAFAFCLYGGIAASVLYALIFVFFRPQIIPLIGGDDASYQYIYNYMFWTMIVGAIPTVGNVLCGHLVRSVGAAKEAGFGMSMGGILNCVLDPLFMFVLLPKGNEVTGAAIATLVSNTCALIYFIVYLAKHADNPVCTIHFKDISFKDRIPQDVLMIGLPAALSTTLAMVSNMFANALIKPYGSAAVAGMGVAKKVNTLAFNTTMGLTQGVLPLLGFTYGARNYDRMKKTIRMTLMIAFGFCTFCMILFELFPSSWISFFIAEPESVRYGTQFLRIISIGCPMTAVTYMLNTVFQASGKKKQSLTLSVLKKGVIDIPLMFLFRCLIGANGVVIATPVSELIAVTVGLIFYLRFTRELEQNQETF